MLSTQGDLREEEEEVKEEDLDAEEDLEVAEEDVVVDNREEQDEGLVVEEEEVMADVVDNKEVVDEEESAPQQGSPGQSSSADSATHLKSLCHCTQRTTQLSADLCLPGRGRTSTQHFKQWFWRRMGMVKEQATRTSMTRRRTTMMERDRGRSSKTPPD